MAIGSDQDLETQFAAWRAHMARRRAVNDADIEELEDHLRATVAELVDVGLRPDEAFLVAVKRMGSLVRAEDVEASRSWPSSNILTSTES